MIQPIHLINISLLAGCLLLQGCQSMKSTFGVERDPPDEFSVLPNSQPLDMPPDFNKLPLPQPGVPSPKEVSARKQQHKKVFGTSSGHKTPGQKELLKLGGTDKSKATIRKEIDEIAEIEENKKKIPILEMVGVNRPAGDAINPTEEVKELQKKGIPQRVQVQETE